MADVFISYAPADKPRVAPIAQALQARGLDVAWDYAQPDPAQARNAVAVLGVWSAAAAGALPEAHHAKERGALVTCLLDKVDPPLGYGHLKPEDFSAFPAAAADAALDRVALAIKALKSPPAPGQATAPTLISGATPPANAGGGIGKFLAPALVVGGLLVAGYVLWPKGKTTDPNTSTHENLGATEHYGLSDSDIASLPAEALIKKAMEKTSFETIDAAASEDKLSLGLQCLAQYYGVGTARDDASAAQSCARGKDQGVSVATYTLSLMTRNGEGGIAANGAAADALLREAANAGDARAQHDLVAGGQAGDPAAARKLAMKCAAQGNIDCRFTYARMLAAGQGGPRDLAAAKTALDALDGEFYAPAIVELGKMYRDGVGVNRNLDEAVIRFKRAAVLDDGEASFLLGQMAEAGEGMAKSNSDAVAFYQAAKAAGYAPADAAIARLNGAKK